MSAPGRQSARSDTATPKLVYCLLAYHFPPATSAGAVRAHGLARELAAAGHEVHVFAPEAGPGVPEGYRVHVVPGRQAGDRLKAALGVAPGASFRSGLPRPFAHVRGWVPRLLREWALFPDGARSWSRRCAGAAAAWLATSRCDVLVSTGPPVSVHVAASRLRGRQARPVWIADWRDLWTLAPQYEYGSLRRWRDLRLERALMSRADAVTVTTEMSGRILAEAYPGVRILPVYNGYNDRSLADAPRRWGDRTQLTITHAGFLYEGQRSVFPLLASISRLISRGDIGRSRVRLQFAGPPDAALSRAIADLGLSDVVDLLGVVPRPAVRRMLAESDVLVVITWDAVREACLIPAKTLEYMAAQRPIVAFNCVPTSELGRLITRTRTGTCVVTDDEIDACLLELYQRFLSEGPLVGNPDRAVLAEYTHARMAGQFDALARSLLAGA